MSYLFDFDDTTVFSVSIKCIFKNTKGIRCMNNTIGLSECCERHRCTFEKDDIRCENVVTKESKYYCNKHEKICSCVAILPNGNMCNKSIYNAYYNAKINFCSEHQCRYMECKNQKSPDCNGLCAPHYYSQFFCQYVNKAGKKCDEVFGMNNVKFKEYMLCVNQMYEEKKDISIIFSSQFEMEKLDTTKSGGYFCEKHTCRVKDCYNRCIDDNIPWCYNHSKKCEYELKSGERCNGYYCTVLHECEKWKECCYLCEKHRCQWTGRIGLGNEYCTEPVEIHDDCEKYCSDHYKIFLFYEYEFV